MVRWKPNMARAIRLIYWLIDWYLNGTSTEKGQFVPTAGRQNGCASHITFTSNTNSNSR